jgi:hypothetical protein
MLVRSVVDTVVVAFDDGSRCKVFRADEGRLIPQVSGSLFPEDEACPYFPGALVRAAAQGVFRGARWLSGSYRGKIEGVVHAVEPGEVTVDWIAAGAIISLSLGPSIVHRTPTNTLTHDGQLQCAQLLSTRAVPT